MKPPDAQNLSDLMILELDTIGINEWHPERDGKGKPTQVHLALTPKNYPGVRLIMRLKSRRAIDDLIAALQKHADSVWPGD